MHLHRLIRIYPVCICYQVSFHTASSGREFVFLLFNICPSSRWLSEIFISEILTTSEAQFDLWLDCGLQLEHRNLNLICNTPSHWAFSTSEVSWNLLLKFLNYCWQVICNGCMDSTDSRLPDTKISFHEALQLILKFQVHWTSQFLYRYTECFFSFKKLKIFNPFFKCTIYSILFYPITLEGRQGTTDEFATIPFHPDLFSAALVELAKSIPVHSLILSSHLFFCLPLFLFPFTVPCRIVFAKPEDLETWPNHLSFRFLTRVRSLSYSPMAAWIFL